VCVCVSVCARVCIDTVRDVYIHIVVYGPIVTVHFNCDNNPVME
jgi:hypothetical protein